MPDVEFELKPGLTSDEILTMLIKQVDNHVMIEALKPFNEYSGER